MKKSANINRHLGFCLLIALIACTREPVPPPPGPPEFANPFDGINDPDQVDSVLIDPASFLGIYNSILRLKCGSDEGACHDGSFEPDYRTLFSAYNSLVYHPPTKNIIEAINGNDTTWVYDHRVTPGAPESSWLLYRLTTDDELLGRMPLYDAPLSETEIDHIRNWILAGAPDPFGQAPSLPSQEPQFFGILAYENNTSGIRLDTNRNDILSPMVFPTNTAINLWFGAVDYNADGTFVLPPVALGYNKIQISDHIALFDGVPELDLQQGLHFGPTLFGGSTMLPFYQNITIQTADYNVNTIYYIRYAFQGALQDSPTIFPETGGQLYWNTYLSFIIQ
jgi:hypothetical protein